MSLCKEIYKKYKDAINLICTYGMTSDYDWILEDFKKDKDIIETKKSQNAYWFLPQEIAEVTPKISKGWNSEYALSFFFIFKENNNEIDLFLEVGPFENSDTRIKFLKYLKEKGFNKITDKSLNKVEGKYTRMFSKIKRNIDFDDKDNLLKVINHMYNDEDTKDICLRLVEVIKEFDWGNN